MRIHTLASHSRLSGFPGLISATGLRRLLLPALCALVGSACSTSGLSANNLTVSSDAGTVLQADVLGYFDSPWAMSFVGGDQLLVTEKPGRLVLVDISTSGVMESQPVSGLPEITSSGQGGLGDVILHPDFADNRRIYLSFVERERGLSGAAVAMATLNIDDEPRLEDFTVVWRQFPKVRGSGHYGYRLAFSPDGYLFITSGERQLFTPAQDLEQNLGKIIRLHDDGSVPIDNPFRDRGELAAEFWSIGHRNPLGIAFDAVGDLWIHEMGPRGGDELNRVKAGGNYGYPLVSDGDHYNGDDIPDHVTRPDLDGPAISWNPVISPSGLVVYSGDRLPAWRGTALIGGLSSTSLVRVSLEIPASELERFDMPRRVREVELGPDGHIYVLEDRADARLLRLQPVDEN